MIDVRIAAGMMRSVVGDKDGNLKRVRNLAAQAAVDRARLLVLPEACLTGYTVRQSMADLAEPAPGPLTEAVRNIAAQTSLTILAGLVEKTPGGQCCLTQALIDADGIIGLYRKTHLGPTEQTRFLPGDRLSVVHHQDVCYGLQLCYEGHFPEISLAQALAGAEILLIPHASPRENPEEKLERWLRYLPARAYDNSVFVAACNQAGDNGDGLAFAGVAMIIGPKGNVLAQAAGMEDRLVIADCRARELQTIHDGRMGFFLPERRPGLYRL